MFVHNGYAFMCMCVPVCLCVCVRCMATTQKWSRLIHGPASNPMATLAVLSRGERIIMLSYSKLEWNQTFICQTTSKTSYLTVFSCKNPLKLCGAVITDQYTG